MGRSRRGCVWVGRARARPPAAYNKQNLVHVKVFFHQHTMLARVNAHVKQHAARQFSHVAAARTLPTIKSLKAYVPDAVHTGEQGGQGSDCHDVPIDHWINGVTPMPIANPMSAYSKYAGARTDRKSVV